MSTMLRYLKTWFSFRPHFSRVELLVRILLTFNIYITAVVFLKWNQKCFPWTKTIIHFKCEQPNVDNHRNEAIKFLFTLFSAAKIWFHNIFYDTLWINAKPLIQIFDQNRGKINNRMNSMNKSKYNYTFGKW